MTPLQFTFFQQEPYYTKCGWVNWWQTIAIPLYIHLEPSDLVEVPVSTIDEFIKLNILKKTDWQRTVSISSPFDTISSEGLTKMMTLFKDTTYRIDWNFRKTTQEENFVLKYKKVPYDYLGYADFKWDSTKTLFMSIINRVNDEVSYNKLYLTDQILKKKVSQQTYERLMLSITDSACLQKVAKQLNVQVDYLFNFELQ